ncbi:hypothetical protein Mgra_00008734, partial [Meloidogyne graminicola]
GIVSSYLRGEGINNSKEEFLQREGKQPLIEKEIKGEGSEIKDFEEFVEINKLLKRGLIICSDLFYSPLKLYKLIANILSKKYQVDLIVYTKENRSSKMLNKNLQIIYLPINKDNLNERTIKYYGIDRAYNEFIESNEYFLIGIYKEIFNNDKILINNYEIGIYEWINQRIKQKVYSFGIAEFSQMAGAFAIFEALKIKNTFDILTLNIALPGDWEEGAEIWEEGSERYNKNVYVHESINDQFKNNLEENYENYYIKLFKKRNIYIKKMPSNFIKLFKKIKYHFVNQNIHGIFKQFPLHKKIFSCVVLVTFGTVKISGGLNINHIEIMFNEFIKYNYCKFKIRIDTKLLKKEYPPNLEITNTKLKQQKILFEKNTKLFISHCGQHSLTEKLLKFLTLLTI